MGAIVWRCALAVVLTIGAAAAAWAQELVNPHAAVCVVYPDGRGAEDPLSPTHYLVELAGGWDAFFDVPGPRWPKGLLTPREALLSGFEVMLHNPFGRWTPMRLDALSAGRRLVGDKIDGSSVHTEALIRAATRYCGEGGKLSFYLGGEQTMPALPGETPAEWASRALRELDPLLRIDPRPTIYFDATKGQPFSPHHAELVVKGGQDGGPAILFERLRREHGVVLGLEPARFASASWLAECQTVTASRFWEARRDRWESADLTGKRQPLAALAPGALVYVRPEAGETWSAMDYATKIVAVRAAGFQAAVNVDQLQKVQLPKGVR